MEPYERYALPRPSRSDFLNFPQAPVLQLEKVTLKFGKSITALDEATLKVHRDEVVGLVGESGSGGLLNNIIGQFTDFVRIQGPKLARLAFTAVGTAIRAVALELFNAVTGNSDSILRSIITDFVRYLKTDAPGDLPMTDFAGTHPEYGGTPVPMERLRELEGRALDLFTDDGQYTSHARDHVLHPSERHTHRAILEQEVN